MAETTRYSVAKTARSYDPDGVNAVKVLWLTLLLKICVMHITMAPPLVVTFLMVLLTTMLVLSRPPDLY